MTELQKAKEERENLVTAYDLAEKNSRLAMDKAYTLKNCLLMGQEGEEKWKASQYWNDEQREKLLEKLYAVLTEL